MRMFFPPRDSDKGDGGLGYEGVRLRHACTLEK